MRILYFIRHGETDWNRAGRLQGHTDIALNARGRAQAVAAGRHLAELGVPLAALSFHVSPLGRACETAALLREAARLPPEGCAPDPRLRELAFGEWEGATWREIRDRHPGHARARDLDRWNFVPPGGESYAMGAERVGAWLEGVRETACVVSHGGIGRVLLHLLGGVAREEALAGEIWQGKVLRLGGGRAEWLPGPGHH